MNFKKEKFVYFYKRLIYLYPRDFRERFGESMEQFFNDVCNEQKRLKGKISLKVIFSIFAETLAGVISENLHEIKGAFMKNLFSSIWTQITSSIVFGLLATLPFVIMEWIYSNGFKQGVPFAVFNFLFVTATILAFLVFSMLRTPFKNPVKKWIPSFLLKILVAIPLVLSWTHLISDQMPCFLGGRGC